MALSVIPLESDPEIFTNLSRKLGLKASYEFTDIFSLDFIDPSTKSVILLAPIDENISKNIWQLEVPSDRETCKATDIKFLPQTIINACGLYALLHSILNNPYMIVKGSKLDDFLQKFNQTSSVECITTLVNELQNEYSDASQEGQTQVPEEIDLHFISFLIDYEDNKLIELDGRRKGPIVVNKVLNSQLSDPLKLLSQRVNQYIKLANDQNKIKFSLMGLAEI